MAVKFNKKIWPNITEAAKDSVADSVNFIYDEVLSLVLDTPKTGRVYPGPHQASAPGEPFANETGNALLKTKKYEENNGLRGRVAGESEYAAILELHPTKARPVFRPAIANKKDDIVKAFKTNISAAIRKS